VTVVFMEASGLLVLMEAAAPFDRCDFLSSGSAARYGQVWPSCGRW